MATRGRKPKPTHLKLVEGNRGHRKLRPEKEPKPRQIIPDAPADLCPDAREEWDRVARQLGEIGLLTEVDRSTFAAYCQAYGRWAVAQRLLNELAEGDGSLYRGLMIQTSQGNWVQNPLVGIANKAARDLVNFAAEFGMTPSARARIGQAPPGDRTDPLDDLMWHGEKSR